MQKYLKYYLPGISLILWGIYLRWANFGGASRDHQTLLVLISTSLVFIASWSYLYFTKPGHRFIWPICLLVLFTLSPFFLSISGFPFINYGGIFLWDKSLLIWQSTLGIFLVGFFYVLRFYFRPSQDAFSVLKLLVVLLIVILSVVNLIFIEDSTTLRFSGLTVFILSIILPLLHTLDMTLWESRQKKEEDDMNSLDSLIEEISGKP